MVSLGRRLLQAVRTCEKGVRISFKKLRKLPLLSHIFKEKCAGDDEEWNTGETFNSTDDSGEAIVCTKPGRRSINNFVTKVDVHKASIYCNNGNQDEEQRPKKAKRRRRRKNANRALAETTSQKASSDDESLSIVVAPCSDLKKIKSRAIDIDEQLKIAEGSTTVKKQRKQRAGQSEDKLCVREKRNDQTIEKSSECKAKANSALKNPQHVLPPVSNDSKIVKSVRVPANVVQTGFEPQVDDEIRRALKKMIINYEKSNNLNDIIYSLTEDKKSRICTQHQQFVTYMTVVTFDSTSKRRTRVGKMIAELLAKKVLSVNAIIHGIDKVLRHCDGYLMKYPHLFSYVASIVAPLLVLNTASFEYFNLKNACSSLRPKNSALLFVEILKNILNFEDTRSVTDFYGTLRLFHKWSSQSIHVPLDVFMPGNQINKYIKNDRVGPLILAMAMFDVAKTIVGNTLLCDMTYKWISRNVDANIFKEPRFVRTLSIATVIACTNKPKGDSNEDFIDRGLEKLLNLFIRHDFPATEIRTREVECIEGCVVISTALGEKENCGGMSFKVFYQLYRDQTICTKSLVTWKNKTEWPTRTETAATLKSFFRAIDNLKNSKLRANGHH